MSQIWERKAFAARTNSAAGRACSPSSFTILISRLISSDFVFSFCKTTSTLVLVPLRKLFLVDMACTFMGAFRFYIPRFGGLQAFTETDKAELKPKSKAPAITAAAPKPGNKPAKTAAKAVAQPAEKTVDDKKSAKKPKRAAKSDGKSDAKRDIKPKSRHDPPA